MTDSMLTAALHWAEQGWKVFPVRKGGKTPLPIRAWQDMATDDPARIVELWTAFPESNIAALCGDDIVGVDVDVKRGGVGDDSLNRLITDHEPFPPTRTHRTPSGGWHYIFRRPADWTASKGKLDGAGYPNIDIQTGIAYLILPPSVTEEGEYSVIDPSSLATVPDWIEPLLSRQAQDAQPERALVQMSKQVGVAARLGERNDRMYRYACGLRRLGHDEDTIVAELVTENSNWARPLPMGELLQIAKSAARYEPGPLGGITIEAIHGRRGIIGVRDVTTARWLARYAGDRLRWLADREAWIGWNGVIWTPVAVNQYLHDARAEARREAMRLDGDLREAAFCIHNQTGQIAGWTACWKMAQTLPELGSSTDEFDYDPYLMNCPNGIINLRSGGLMPHDPDARMTQVTDAEYDRLADTGKWEEFVLWCAQGDAELARWLQVLFGQAMIGQQQEHLIAFLYGLGSNGKTAMMEAILRTIGGYGLEAAADLVTAKGRETVHTEAIASLRARRLVVCPEPEKGSYWNAGRLKALTGGESIRTRHLFESEFDLHPTFTLVVHGNYEPEVRDQSEGFHRRIRLVPFRNRVSGRQMVKDLGKRMAGPAVLKWLVEGALEYQRAGDTLPGCALVETSSRTYMVEQDMFAAWSSQCLERDFEGPQKPTAHRWWTPTRELYSSYQYWAEKEQGLRYIETAVTLGTWMASQGYSKKMKERAGQNVRGWMDVKVRQAQDETPI
jgi:putative DNA primase/helicase